MSRSGMEWTNSFRLGDACRIVHGYAFSSRNMTSEDDVSLPIVVNIVNFRYDGGFRFDTTPVQRLKEQVPSEYILKAGDILVIMTCQTPKGEILGIPGQIPNDSNTYLHNQRLGKAVITNSSRLDPSFLYHLFCSSGLNRHLFVTSTGNKIKHTAPSRIEDYCFSLPPPRRAAQNRRNPRRLGQGHRDGGAADRGAPAAQDGADAAVIDGGGTVWGVW